MADRPESAAEHGPERAALVRATCLHVATRLGDIADELVGGGGLVPSLLMDQTTLPGGSEAHAGAVDLDLGLTVALLDAGRCRTLTEALRRGRLSPT